jgi:ABC-type transport system involved in cytochrome bd biosynthesis fused ATPase/permease subunit
MKVVLRDVTTCWPGDEPIRLDDIDVGAGRRLAVVGDAGAGTSALAAVLLRIVDYRGSITLDGMELRELAGDVARRIIAHCGQDAHVIDATVAENVRIARPDSSDAELAAVLHRTGLDGTGRPVLARERQRIALARALLADVPVLVVDEPTVHRRCDALLIDLLTAAIGRTVLLTVRRTALPGADPVLRHVDEVISVARPSRTA